jgi:outer membrane protein assembly factor BamB
MRHFGLAVAAAGALWSCAVFGPVGPPPRDPIAATWTRRLYTLEPIAFKPQELGQLKLVTAPGGPPGGLLVVPSRDRKVRGLRAADGGSLWELETGGPNVARPTVIDGDVVFGSMDGNVYRVHQRNGGIAWKAAHGSAVLAEAAIDRGRVYVTGIDNRLTALDAATGERLWFRKRPHVGHFTVTGQAGAAVVGDTVVSGFSDGRLIAFAQSDGATVWDTDLAAGKTDFVDVDTTPVLAEGRILAASYAVGLFAIDVASGRVHWSVRGKGFGQPAVDAGVVYAPQANGRVLALQLENGEPLWIARLTHEVPLTPAVTSRVLLVAGGEGLFVLDRGSGRFLANYRDYWGFSATPEVGPDAVYAQSASGVLYAFDLH